jgi:uncharacterized Zn ribbon protein
MKYVLTCGCTSTDFTYHTEEGFTCNDCGTQYSEEEAGKHLLEEEE